MPRDARWCFAWFAEKPGGPRPTRAALQVVSKWRRGQSINVAFLDGEPSIRARVRAVALRWVDPGPANLRLCFVADPEVADIRISFRYEGSWSTIGSTCRSVTNPTQPTMNFGWLDEDSHQDEVDRVVLHEFGHALGLLHEHQNPAAGIQWDRDAVITDLSGPPNNWSEEQIESNIFNPFSRGETNYTEFDPKSIMIYPIPPHWTLDGFELGLNDELSRTDKAFVRKEYL